MSVTSPAPVLDRPDFADEQFLQRMRDEMLRFSRLQLGQDVEAEDAVQEALAGALRNADRFRGEAAFKTWIIAILKVADILRHRKKRPIDASQMQFDDNAGPLPAKKCMWSDSSLPSRWEDPEADIQSHQLVPHLFCSNRYYLCGTMRDYRHPAQRRCFHDVQLG